jgi:hypothetical protein
LAALAFAVIFSAPNQATSEDVSPATIETVDVPLIAWVSSRAHALPDSLTDFVTADERTKTFREFVEGLAALDRQKAAALAKELKYQLVQIDEGGKTYLVASDDSGSGRDPIIVINTAPSRDVIFEAPHVPFEVGTAEEAIILLSALDGIAALIPGAHRCASKSFDACDGKTPVCLATRKDEPYRDSDVSHNTQTLFQVAHVVLAERWKNAVVVSLHGMKDDDNGVHTSVIISDGTALKGDQAAAYPAMKLRLALASGAEPGAVVSCNLADDKKYEARKLCGSTNVQGRNVNGDPDACRGNVGQATGRFIHMEQDWGVLKPYAQNWLHIGEDPRTKKLIEALNGALPANP